MGIDKTVLENLFFIGIVSAIEDISLGTVRVTRPDKDNKPTAPLKVLQRGTHIVKDFWLPQVGDQVLCIQLPNFSGKGVGEGFVLGACYSNPDPAAESDANARSIRNADGSFIRYDGNGTIEINAASEIRLTAPVINLNE